ncbi:MAG: DUF3473 domain-containing protein, partial [Planctomycetota bacterium]
IFPVYHDKYGIPDAPRFPHRIDHGKRSLLEFPPTVYRIWKYNLPIAGGGYFRLYPARLTIHCLGRINRRNRHPFVFYIHPWELDPDQPRLPGSLRSRFRHYQNLRKTEGKLGHFLRAFKLSTLSDALHSHDPNAGGDPVADAASVS